MKLLESVWNEFIYGGHFTAFTITLFPVSVSILIGTPLDFKWIFPVYLGCYGAYLFNRFEELGEDIRTNPERSKYLESRRANLPFYIVSSIALMFIIPIILQDYTTLSFFLLLTVLSLAYSTHLKNLTKKVPCFKNFYLALMFTLLCLLPFFKYQKPLSDSSIFLLFFIFSRIFVNSAFSDFKDIESDKKKELLTLPVMTPGKARKILSSITIFSFLILSLGILMKLVPTYFFSLSLVTIYSLIYLNISTTQELHLTLWSDSEGLVMFISSLLGVTLL
ncbi:MAG: hypothetical protein DRP00_05940 [Candidatus Aenigmatarchaeota archaeon]|nr:MAG: hypothetical protein DRP00_05940 [Candidatus Aenigmarchaeota archaeon]